MLQMNAGRLNLGVRCHGQPRQQIADAFLVPDARPTLLSTVIASRAVCRCAVHKSILISRRCGRRPRRGKHVTLSSHAYFPPEAHLDMTDTDIIASIYPFEDYAGNGEAVVRDIENQHRLISTQPIVAEDDSSPPNYHGAGLALRFSQPPRVGNGFVFGYGLDCDIILPHLPGIGVHHFAITFDEQYRIVVKDLDSTGGTEVTFNGHGSGRLREFSWVVGGDILSQLYTEIVINVNDILKFQIVVADHDIMSPLYIYNVDRLQAVSL